MATIHWIAGSGDWNTPGNWDSNTVPGPSDDAVLDASGAYTVTASSDATINSLSGIPTATLEVTGGTFTVTNFTADGPVVQSGGTLDITAAANNVGTFTLQDGAALTTAGLTNSSALNVDATGAGGSSLTVDGTLTNSNDLELGDGSSTPTFVTVQGLTNTGTIDINAGAAVGDSGALTNSAGGVINIAARGLLTLSGAASDQGLITLTGGTLTGNGGAALTIDAASINGALAASQVFMLPAAGVVSPPPGPPPPPPPPPPNHTLSGSGTVSLALINDGSVEASGGTLDVAGAISGSGQLSVDAGATFEIGDSNSETMSFGANIATFRLDAPSRVSGAFTGLVLGDTIDLAGVDATGAAIVGDEIVVTTPETTYSYQVEGALSGDSFAVLSDGHGGSDLVLGTGQVAPYSNFYAAGGALKTDGQDGVRPQVPTDALNIYTTSVAGAIGTVGSSGWLQAFENSATATRIVANDIAGSRSGQQIRGDALALYNTIVAGVVGSVAQGASQQSYTATLQAAGTLGTDIANAAGGSQLQSDLTSLFAALAGNAIGSAAWQQASNSSAQALGVVSSDETDGATSAQLDSDIASFYDFVVSGGLSAAGGSSLQQAYEGGGHTIVTLGSDIANGGRAVQLASDSAEGATATGLLVRGARSVQLASDTTGIYTSVVRSVAGGTAGAGAMETYTASIAGANTLASDAAASRSGNFASDASYVKVYADAATTPSQTIDWASLETSSRPAYIDATDWNNIWTGFVGLVGTTQASFAAATAQASAELGQLGQPTTDLSTLLQFELLQANGGTQHNYIASSSGLAGPSLSLSLSYDGSLATRDDKGAFGDGWTFTYDVKLVNDGSGYVYIDSPSGVEAFSQLPGNGFQAAPGDLSTLSRTGFGYELTAANGTKTDFDSSGRLQSITDLNGNSITAQYAPFTGILQSLASSTGERITFTSNQFGDITSATDSDGQQATYTYDSTGTQLLGVSTSTGTTSFSYNGVTGSAADNALTMIANPDGTHAYFSYNPQGLLASEHGDNGVGLLTYVYNGSGQVSVTDANGHTTTTLYDANGNAAQVQSPNGQTTHNQYNASGKLTGIAASNGVDESLTYDAYGNLSSNTNPLGQTVSATYAPGTNLLTGITDPKGNTTRYSHDSAGDLTGVTYEDGSGVTYRYASDGALVSSTNARGQATTYAYNAKGELTLESFSDGTFQSYGYDSQGEVVSSTATNGEVSTYGYNAAGEVASVTDPSGRVESYTYDSSGRELTRTEPDGSVTRYSYNAAGELAGINDGAGNLIRQFSYNSLGQLTGTLDGNGQTTSYGYDANSHVTQIVTRAADASVTSQLGYTYDANGRVATATSSDGAWTYGYDAAGQVTSAAFASTNSSIPNQNLTYAYDAAGNRTHTVFNGAVNDYTTNGLNQYTASDGTTYGYDADGNLVSMTQNGATTTYGYNPANQLTAVNGPNGNFTYQYDAFGNMLSSTANGVVSNYVVDPLAIPTATGALAAIAQAYDASGSVTATYEYGDGLAAQINAGGTYYYNADGNGNVASLSGSDGGIADTYLYSPFGGLVASSGDVANPFQFGGASGVTTGASGLDLMGARLYDPATGRFLSRDPIGSAGGTNLYAYSGNNPVNLVDPTGLSGQSAEMVSDSRVQIIADGLANELNSGQPGQQLKNQLIAQKYAENDTETQAEVNQYNQQATNIAVGFVAGSAAAVVAVPVVGAVLAADSAATATAAAIEATYSSGLGVATRAAYQTVINTVSSQAAVDVLTSRLGQAAGGAVATALGYGTLGAGAATGDGGSAYGDVHMVTYDGLYYDFQAAGEFILTQSTQPGNSYQIQVRLQPQGDVTLMTMVGAQVGSDRVTFGIDRPDTVWIDGAPATNLTVGSSVALSGGTLTELGAAVYQIAWQTGELMIVGNDGDRFDVSQTLGPSDGPGSVQGLAGPDEGQAYDFQLPDGTVLQQPLTSSELYGAYADAWRVTQANSLLDYGPNQTTATFTIPNFPPGVVTTGTLSQALPQNLLNQAATLATAAGITDPNTLAAAELDYLATGDPSFLTAAANSQPTSGDTTTAANVQTTSAPSPMAGVGAAQTSVVDPNPTVLTFPVYLTSPVAADTTLDWTVVAPDPGDLGAAAFGGTLPSGEVTIAAGQTSGQFTVTVPDSALGNQPSAVVKVQVSSPDEPLFATTAQTTVVNPNPVAGTPVAPQLALLSNVGTLAQNGNDYTLDLGNVVPGEALPVLQFALMNAASAPADSLGGSFDTPSGVGFVVTGASLPTSVAAGQSYNGLEVTADTGVLGSNYETIVFNPQDTNLSGYSASLSPITLTITDNDQSPAAATINSPSSISFSNVRVGAPESQVVSVTNSAGAGAASLDASATASGDATASGGISNLAPNATDSTDLSVVLDTSAAGPANGLVRIDFSSDAGTGVAAPLPSQTVAVAGAVYRPAAASIPGIVAEVGDPTTSALDVTNTDPADGYSENLIATVVGTTGAVTASGTTGDIAPGADGSIAVDFPTSAAGQVGTVTLDLQSDGNGIDGLGVIDLGDVTIPVTVTSATLTAGAIVSFTGGGPAVALDSGLAVNGPGSAGNLAGATVSIATGFLAGDTLNFTNQSGITGNYDPTQGILALSGTASVADYQTALDSITYGVSPSNVDPTDGGTDISRTIDWVVNDGTTNSNTATSTLDTFHAAPALTAGAKARYTPAGGSIVLDNGLAVTDADSGDVLTGATVQVIGGTFANDGDVLGTDTTGTAISASYNAASETLTLTGSDSFANYQSVLDQVTFASGANPTNSGADRTRTISWTATDGTSGGTSATAISTISLAPVSADFSGDGKSGVIWQNDSGPLFQWQMNGFAVAASGPVGGNVSLSWHVAGVGDFDGDTKSDILFQNDDGQLYEWQMNGFTVVVAGSVGGNVSPSWHVVATGDFNGDGKSDVLFQNDDGQLYEWQMNGFTVATASSVGGNVNPSWHVVGTGDFDGDGKSDILFQNDDGHLFEWQMNGSSVVSAGAVGGNVSPSWHVVGTGDFNGDGKSDILFQNDDGHLFEWQMNGFAVTASGAGGGNVNPSWHVAEVGDFGGDTKSDVLFQNDDGQLFQWQMNGFIVASAGSVGGNVSPSWHVA